MDENQFYVWVWTIVAACFIALVLTIGGCEGYTRALVMDSIKAGADPLKASCAINGFTSTSTICALIATKPEAR